MRRPSVLTILLWLFVIGALATRVSAAESVTTGQGPDDQSEHDRRMAWWREARFGLFIHWGLYSVAGGEWQGKDYGKEMGGASAEWLMNSANIPREEYRNSLAPRFNPTRFNATEWVATAKNAGAKYIVITAKHHEGFCLFDSQYTDYDVVDATPFKRDVIKELSEECKKQGIRLGLYYSQSRDWYHRGRGSNHPGIMSDEEYVNFVKNQLRELLTNYGDIAIIWFDTGSNDVEENNQYGAVVRQLQPQAIICSRLYGRGVPPAQRLYADFESLPDRTIAPKRMEGDYETCMPMRSNWGYDRDDNNWKSTKELIHYLVLSAARGVNFLLNVGPTPEGTFCPEEMERLKEMGAWMKINGDSIYGSRPSPVDFDFPWGTMTQKDRLLYLHVLDGDAKDIVFYGVVGKPVKAYLLADPGTICDIQYDDRRHITTVHRPAVIPDDKDTVIVVEYHSPPTADPNAQGEYYWPKATERKTRRRL